MKNCYRIYCCLLFFCVVCMLPSGAFSQEEYAIDNSNDTINISKIPDSLTIHQLKQADTLAFATTLETPFKPNPKKAVIYSAALPGLGQIYNRKYWKLPLVYGGFMGFFYAISWNNKNLVDYSNGYKHLSYDLENNKNNPGAWSENWTNMVPNGKDPKEYFTVGFKNDLKRGKDFYRRYRDLSIILTMGWYFICMADAYVDAQLFDFDISPDLSMRIEPVVSPRTAYQPQLYGINCSIKF